MMSHNCHVLHSYVKILYYFILCLFSKFKYKEFIKNETVGHVNGNIDFSMNLSKPKAIKLSFNASL